MARTHKLNGRRVSEDSPEWKAFCERNSGGVAAICESGKFPGMQTDTTFMRGVGVNALRDNEMDEETYAAHKAKAARFGMSLEGGKYFGSMANGPLDLGAWQWDFNGVKNNVRYDPLETRWTWA